MCFGKLEHLTLGLDQIHYSANSVTSCRMALLLLLHLKTLICAASVEIVRKEFSKVHKSARNLSFSVPNPNYPVHCTFEVCNGLIHCLLPYEYLITLKWLTFTDPYHF